MGRDVPYLHAIHSFILPHMFTQPGAESRGIIRFHNPFQKTSRLFLSLQLHATHR